MTKNWKMTDEEAVVSAAARDWSEINGDVLELILLKLPETSVIRASSVCSRWNAVARSEKFIQFYVEQVGALRPCPRFTVKGSKYCFRQNEAGQYDSVSAFDPSEVPSVMRPKGESTTCYEGAGGLFYFFAGPRDTVLHYKLSVLQREWLVTPEMTLRNHEPIVGVVRIGVKGAHKLVVAGGIADVDDNDEDLAVEIYDSVTRTWEMSSSLPHAFRGCTTSLFMNPAVYDGKFYAYDNYASFCSVLDLSSKRWSAATVVRRPQELKQSYLVENSRGLSLVGVQNSGLRDLLFCAWNVDPQSLQLKEPIQKTIIVNARPAPPSSMRLFFDRFVDQLGGVLGIFLLLTAYVIVLSYGWFTRSRSHVQSLLLSFSSRLPCCQAYASAALERESRQVVYTRWLPWFSH